MIEELIRLAEDGGPLWLPELRRRFACAPGASPVRVRLEGGAYGRKDFTFYLPPFGKREERVFLLRCCSAVLFNLLSAYSAKDVTLYADSPSAELLRDAAACFEDRSGLRKARNVAGRIYGSLCFSVEPMSAYRPLEQSCGAASADLCERLLALIRRPEEKGCVGIDVGGSDIKLAVSCKGRLLHLEEYDWNPAASPTADGILEPILSLVRAAREKLRQNGGTLDAVGISFPDVVIEDRIVGGETPKTKGMRENAALEYESEFARLGELKEKVLALCEPGAAVRITNDGNMAAFTAAVELAAGGSGELIRDGVIAHSLGTDLGTGWLMADGRIPAIPLELYDLQLDLGSLPAAALPPEDLRSTRNENSGMPGVRRYLGQAAAYRIAWELAPELLDPFLLREGELLTIPTSPRDLRKPCLAHLMRLADEGIPEAEEIFRRIGRNLSVVAQEMDWLFGVMPPQRFLFGRFVKAKRCFELICEGFGASSPDVRLIAANEDLANTPLMKQLAAMEDFSVAQFAQAVGAIYFAFS